MGMVSGLMVLTAGACDSSSSPTPSASSAAPSSRPPSPSPEPAPPTTAPLPRGTAPLATIPSVRSFTGSDSGRGWWPRPGTRVIAGSAELVDEARLLAGELDVTAAGPDGGTPPREGDVRLVLEAGSAPPEGYRMDSRRGRLVITGSTDAGVFYGTRTALQALRARGHVPPGVAEDHPDRPQRGLSVDIARKHFTAAWLRARVREMGDLKLNQLHLHLSDDQGFRVESSSHPEIVSARHLTKREVRGIVALARSRHITVVPEIDSPGHLGAVLRAHPELQLRDVTGTPLRGAVDISQPAAGRLVDDLIREYADLFPGRYWHLGGDEYLALRAEDPERSYPQLAADARRRFGPDATVADAATGWLNDRQDTVRAVGKQAKAWNDGFHSGPRVAADRDREVEYWTGREFGQREPQEFLRAGRPVVNVNDEFLYYVLGEPNNFTYPTGERIYRQWSPAVLRGTRPVPRDLAGPDQVLGGRLAVWCDFSDAQTEAQVARGIRMPLRALAQRVWDPEPPSLPWTSFVRLADRVDGD
ncbi:beta-N-acetylhexosaminidase [Wenjunlia vitaminophila]|nr:glycoside hydrolase family 20 protein [Wenjunlia vitaminophila]